VGIVAEQIKDFMVSEVVTVERGTGVVDAAKRMIQEKKGPLPVVEGDRVVAMVTDRDVIARVVAEGRDPTTCSVDEIATTELVTARPDQDVDEARRLMSEHELDRILVTEEGDRLVGIISEGDIRADEGPLTEAARGAVAVGCELVASYPNPQIATRPRRALGEAPSPCVS
jgi:CBS domain-containing protein